MDFCFFEESFFWRIPFNKKCIFANANLAVHTHAHVVKLVDMPSWGGGAIRCAGSNPVVGTLIKSTCSSEQVLFYFSPSPSARGWAKAKNKKAPSERSEEVLLIHCTSPTTGSPTDREVILSHAAAMRKEERENRARARGSWAKRMTFQCPVNSALCVSKTNAPLSY